MLTRRQRPTLSMGICSIRAPSSRLGGCAIDHLTCAPQRQCKKRSPSSSRAPFHGSPVISSSCPPLRACTNSSKKRFDCSLSSSSLISPERSDPADIWLSIQEESTCASFLVINVEIELPFAATISLSKCKRGLLLSIGASCRATVLGAFG